MIELHRPERDAFSDRIEEQLEDLVVSHKIRRYSDNGNNSIQIDKLPRIEENGKTVEGKENIKRYLRELESELRQQRMITGDSCYIDPETGEVC